MHPAALGTRGSIAGAALLSTCVCSIDKIAFGAAAGGMVSTRFGANLYTLSFGTALALIVAGLAARSRAAGVRAAVGALGLGVGLALSPPSVMHGTVPNAAQFAGFALTIAGMAAVVWAFLTTFSTEHPGADTCCASGLGCAAGCSCCVTSGALSSLLVAAGVTLPPPPFADGIPYVAFMTVALLALYQLAGPRLTLVAFVGAVIAFGGDETLKLLPNDVELLPRLMVTALGTGIVFWAVARGFRSAGATAAPRSRVHSDDPLAASTRTRQLAGV
jgi:hypothetical protein